MPCIVLGGYRMLAGKGETWPISGVQFADGRAYCDAIVGESLVSGYHVMASCVPYFTVGRRDNSEETLDKEKIIEIGYLYMEKTSVHWYLTRSPIANLHTYSQFTYPDPTPQTPRTGSNTHPFTQVHVNW